LRYPLDYGGSHAPAGEDIPGAAEVEEANRLLDEGDVYAAIELLERAVAKGTPIEDTRRILPFGSFLTVLKAVTMHSSH
jgi:hypothetical protein